MDYLFDSSCHVFDFLFRMDFGDAVEGCLAEFRKFFGNVLAALHLSFQKLSVDLVDREACLVEVDREFLEVCCLEHRCSNVLDFREQADRIVALECYSFSQFHNALWSEERHVHG